MGIVGVYGEIVVLMGAPQLPICFNDYILDYFSEKELILNVKEIIYYIMRRTDREITDPNRIEDFLAKEQILRIGFFDHGEIYIVPVNYGYSYIDQKYSFYFHGAKAGRKYELAKAQPQVAFEIDGSYQLLEGTVACEYSAGFQSVIGTGILHLVEEKEEKVRGLNAIMKQTTQKAEWKYEDEMLEAVAVFRLDVDKLSCKAK